MTRSRTPGTSATRRRTPARLRRFAAVLTAGMAAAMVVALSAQYARTLSLAHQAESLEQKRRELAADNESLREEIRRLLTDDRYIEQLAREQLGLLKPGEVELQIVSSGSDRPGTNSEAAARVGPEDNGQGDTHGMALPWLARLWTFIESVLARLRS